MGDKHPSDVLTDDVILDESELALLENPEPIAEKKNKTKVHISADELLEKLDALLNPVTPSGSTSSSNSSAASKSRNKRQSGTAAQESGRKTEAEEDKQLLEDELNETFEPTHITKQPSTITAVMRDYQIEALNWMMQIHDKNLNGILADEMGLGKTLETISLLAYLREFRKINGKHIVIVPKSTLTNWAREINKWCPLFKVLTLHGTKEERAEQIQKIPASDIIVTTYEVCIIEQASIRRVSFEYIIIDEAHRIKNENAKVSQVIRTFKSKHRLLITGTPLQNNLHELWALLNFLKPDLFNSHEDFETLFDLTSSDCDQDTVVKRLHRILRPFLLRRLKSDVVKSLPPKVETKLYVGLSAMQRDWYTKILSRDIDALNGNQTSKTQLLNIMMQLRKVCNHPYLFDGAEPGPPYEEGPHLVTNSGKMVLLDKLLKKLKEEGSRVLIFSQMTRLLDILEDYCLWKRYEYCRIDGKTSQSERDDAMDVFNAPNSSKFIFLLSTRAGSLGINLQTADTVILFDSDWNPQMDLQAMDRAHRIGQKKPVNVFRFVTEDSVEAKIVERATKKLALDALVIQKGRLLEQEKSASSQELQSMIRFGASYIFNSKGQVTDEDIEVILHRSKEKTAQENEKLKEGMENLLNFSLNQAESEFKTLTFEGKDYSGIRKPDDEFIYIAPPQRERNISFDENEYFRSALTGNKEARPTKPAGPKEFRPAIRPDFQFFDVDRINVLEKKNWTGLQKLKAIRQEYSNKLRQELKEKVLKEKEKERLKQEAEAMKDDEKDEKVENEDKVDENEDTGVMDDDDDDENDDDDDDAQMKLRRRIHYNLDENGKVIDEDIERNLRDEAGCCTEAEEKELEKLLSQGFPDWRRADLGHFITACATYGRRDLTNISQAVEGHDPADVKRYHKVFFQKYKQIKDHDKLIKQIERGEAALKRRQDIERLIDLKLSTTQDPLNHLTFEYPTKQVAYDLTNDRYLLLSMKHHGFGNWNAIRRDIIQAPQHRFDWFIKSRSIQEISKRCEFLLKIVEKELENDGEVTGSTGSNATSGPIARKRGAVSTTNTENVKKPATSRSRRN